MAQLFTESHAYQLFPTVVFQHRVAHADVLNRKLERVLRRERQQHPTWKGHTSPWQCTPDLHERPPFQPLVRAVHEAVRVATQSLHHVVEGHRITGMWATWLKEGELHPPHAHANNHWSGVYWVRNDDPRSARLTFLHPNLAAAVLLPAVREATLANSTEWSFEARPGVLTLFPSYLLHYVRTVGSGERISVAFNLMVHGDLQVPDSLQHARIG